MIDLQKEQLKVATGVTDNTQGYTPAELDGITKMHEEGRCMPFIEFKLANGLIIRFLRDGLHYACILNSKEANNFLTGEWK